MRKSSIRLRNFVYTIMLALLVGGFGFGSIAWAESGNLHGPQGDRGQRPDRNAARVVVADDTMPADDVEGSHRPDRADRDAREDDADRADRGDREDDVEAAVDTESPLEMKTPGHDEREDNAARPAREREARATRAARPAREGRADRPERPARPERAGRDRD